MESVSVCWGDPMNHGDRRGLAKDCILQADGSVKCNLGDSVRVYSGSLDTLPCHSSGIGGYGIYGRAGPDGVGDSAEEPIYECDLGDDQLFA